MVALVAIRIPHLVRNHNYQVVVLRMIDARDEADYNLFHRVDSTRLAPGRLQDPWVKSLPADAIKVVMSNSEEVVAV